MSVLRARSLLFFAAAWSSSTSTALGAEPEKASIARASAPSLRERFGVTRLEAALKSVSSLDRERALARLGSLGSARALDLLAKALDPSGAAQSPRERLIAVRALGPHVAEPRVRECLVRVMTGISSSAEHSEPLQALLRDTAALSLAKSGDPAALEALTKALRQPGRVAQAAAAAIVAHPPSDLAALARAHYSPTPELVGALEQLGDERAFELLRDVVRRGSPELRERAAIALTRLGNFETVELAQSWERSAKDPGLLLTALEILSLAHDEAAKPLLEKLLANPATRLQALGFVVPNAGANIERALQKPFVPADRGAEPARISALGRSGGPLAIEELSKLAREQRSAEMAVYALAQAPAEAAGSALARLLDEPAHRRRAARGAVLRKAIFGEPVAGLDAALEGLIRSADSADRSVAAFGLSFTDPERAEQLLKASDPVVSQAAARAAPFAGAADTAARRLAVEPRGPVRTQLALCLVDPAARGLVPTRVLLELVAESGPATPLALFALSERDSAALRPRLLDALKSPDASRRAHAALGLSNSIEPSVLGVLEKAYAFEADADVRLAIVKALSRRPEAARERALELAAGLDPESRVREAAWLGLRGIAPSVFVQGAGTLWMILEDAAGNSIAATSLRVAGGLMLPVLADPDGSLTLVGLPSGKVSPLLALEPRERKASTEDF